MKGYRRWLGVILLVVSLFFSPVITWATDTEQLTDELLTELELDDMESFLQEQQSENDLDISFGGLIKGYSVI